MSSTTETSPNGGLACEWTGGKGVDHVMDIGGPSTLTESTEVVKISGHIAMIGILGGMEVIIPKDKTILRRGAAVRQVELRNSESARRRAAVRLTVRFFEAKPLFRPSRGRRRRRKTALRR